MVFLPLYGLWAQLQVIKKEKSMGSFSIYITAIYILCSIFKIFFWFAKGFAMSILIQSILITAICVPYVSFSCASSTSTSNSPPTKATCSG